MIQGKVWKIGDDVDTDALSPGYVMQYTNDVNAQHCLESYRPDFAKNVRVGDLILAGENFGIGSSRAQAAYVLQILGIKAVFAKSYARIFYRNLINSGIPAYFFDHYDAIKDQEILRFSLQKSLLEKQDGTRFTLVALPSRCMDIIKQGGLMGFLKQYTKDRLAIKP